MGGLLIELDEMRVFDFFLGRTKAMGSLPMHRSCIGSAKRGAEPGRGEHRPPDM